LEVFLDLAGEVGGEVGCDACGFGAGIGPGGGALGAGAVEGEAGEDGEGEDYGEGESVQRWMGAPGHGSVAGRGDGHYPWAGWGLRLNFPDAVDWAITADEVAIAEVVVGGGDGSDLVAGDFDVGVEDEFCIQGGCSR
jgi:hypothetical protein